MMYLARVIAGGVPQVFMLTGALFVERKSWSFVSYKRGACAIGFTAAEASQAAKRRLDMPRQVNVRIGRS